MIAFCTATIRSPIAIIVLLYTLLPLFTIGYTLNTKPFDRKTQNRLEITNEIFIYISGYFLIIFSEWIYKPEEDPQDI